MKENNQIGEQIVDHLTDGELPVSSNPILEEWKQANINNKNDFEKYQKIWKATADVSILRKFDSGKAWDQVNLKLKTRQVRIRCLKNLAYAASGMAASILIFLGLSFYTQLYSVSDAPIAMSTTYGNRSEVTLPDGSHVKLNAGSSLEYRYDKIQKIRNVNFSGEGFFEVAKSKNPFIIHTSDGLNVKVLGTKFNLITYPEDNFVQTALVEGRVELSHPGLTSLILKPGQIGSFDKKSHDLKYKKGEVFHMTSWMQNKLYMENMSLLEVCTRLERWYDVKIGINDKRLGETIHYTGVLKEQSVLDVLNALCQLSSIKYDVVGKNITISGK